MVTNNFVDHQGSNDQYAQDRMRENCYYPKSDQEIVWGGATNDPATIINTWLADTNWKNAMLDSNMEDIGVAYRSGGDSNSFDYYFVINFGDPEDTSRTITSGDQPVCELTLENEHGRGSWRIYSVETCQELGID